MFAVNYKSGGEDDPILSYSDELIDGVIGKGLLKRFFWQRLAIMRNGQWYETFIKLNNYDDVDYLADDLVLVQKNKLLGIYSLSGELVLPIEYDEVSAFTLSEIGPTIFARKKDFEGYYEISAGKLTPIIGAARDLIRPATIPSSG